MARRSTAKTSSTRSPRRCCLKASSPAVSLLCFPTRTPPKTSELPAHSSLSSIPLCSQIRPQAPCTGVSGVRGKGESRIMEFSLHRPVGTRRRPSKADPRMEDIKKALEEQIKALEYELTTELPAEIKKAVALGDLSENAEYHMAKQRQEFVNARLGQLKKRMGELAMVNLDNIPKDQVGFGSTVVVFDSTKEEEITYKLVTSEESDVTKGLISTTSPIGRSLLKKEVGDSATVITPAGKRELEILKLYTIHDKLPETK